MSGHSKWHNIQVKKGKQDKLKASAFTKAARMITIAASQGGGDPDANFSLRLALEKAKEVNMPKDNIDRAIKKGTGDLSDAAALEQILYEGYGPGGVGVLVDVVTDNKNRTASEIKHVFSLHNGSLAGPGSVKWQFVHLGVVRLDESQMSKVKDKMSDFELSLIDAGAEDISSSDFGIEIFCPIDKLQKVLEKVKSLGLDPASSGMEWVAKEKVALTPDKSTEMQTLYDALDDMDDVKEVFTNEAV